ncbi:helix-turn-helix domain-containing protein [Escherichia coli]|uniref:helix-turn-helix domain-containing protein n=1 Tax=Escherichia coli TaxID=562 RepID=UPI0013C6FE70|nr:helix-turn-helix domain-containing protein [Escherichia coli]EEY5749144.1 helix-turn-helix domain-containing protein [Escherichia coli]EFB2528281.1 helix-turn-helix domain-containing protein [Escherichia coli]EFL9475424.1 helix-turn-helix domain-containing protein [Escherichia coli]EFM9862054.1 helix-turn-helix domain-containing protein [Escherichia coli]EFO1556865.1 helix-turn-helix domain-containing protein [Escherichia coli]
MNILPTAYASRQGESQQRYESASNELQVIYRENLAAEQPTQSEKKSAVDIVNELRSKAAAKTSQTAPRQEAPEEPEQAEATQDDQPQGDKADSSGDNLDKVRSYRKFETERYVNDRLFRDGFLEVLSPAAVKLLLFIGSKCNDDGVCFHAHETMMQLTGLSRNTIKRAITELIENKLIETKAVAGKSNHYRLL